MTVPGRPLSGRTVVVTRAAHQAADLISRLEAAGAEVVAVPTIAADPVEGSDQDALTAAAGRLHTYRWVVWTSTNGVDATLAHRAAEASPPQRVAVVGRATAARVRGAGLPVDLVPGRHTGADLVAAFPAAPVAAVDPGDPGVPERVLVAQGDRAAPTVADGLRAKGWEVEIVTAYRTRTADVGPDLAARAARADAITFTSGSTVTGYRATGAPVPPVVVTIGPVTTAAAEAAGMTVTAEAAAATLDGLVAALVQTLAGP